MLILKVLNNNAVLATDDEGRESVLIGKGLAWGRNSGEKIEPAAAEKIFAPRAHGVAEKLSHAIEHVPLDHIRVSDEIINVAKTRLPNLNVDSLWLSLVDHVSFAIERHSQGVDLTTSLEWEMKQLYPAEHEVGTTALHILEKRLGVTLPTDEAAFIAFHLVNASPVHDDRWREGLEAVRDVLTIVDGQFPADVDRESYAYGRLATHLRYFVDRLMRQVGDESDESNEKLLRKVSRECPQEADCVRDIAEYVQRAYSVPLSVDERIYLIIHINRVRRGVRTLPIAPGRHQDLKLHHRKETP